MSGRNLRTHQRELAGVVEAIASGASSIVDILAAVCPGGGKSLLPVIAASRLIAAGLVDRVCWIVPRSTLQLQAEEAFADPGWRTALQHAVSVRAAGNETDPCRGLQGYVTTYQAVSAAPDLHLAEFRRHRYLLVVDEVHHLPVIAEADSSTPAEEASWSRAILPLMETASIRLLLSGTLERADGRAILGLPYRRGSRNRTREVDLDTAHMAVVGYSRRVALAERAVLPVTFGAMDGTAEWLDSDRRHVGPHRISGDIEIASAALFTALRTGFARDLLRAAFDATRDLRAARRAALGVRPGEEALGLGKLLVVAPDQESARRYLGWVHSWLPRKTASHVARIATSDERDAYETLAALRVAPEPSIVVTVAMAAEGFDAPSVAVLAALTHIRSRTWLEQMVARATRVDPQGGDYDSQRALVFHPSDRMFDLFRRRIETEQGTIAKEKIRRKPQGELNLGDDLDERGRPIIPLTSNATTLRYVDLAPGPDFAAARPEHAQLDLLTIPSILERDLRRRVATAVATQVIEDGLSLRIPRGAGAHHAFSAVLKRMLGKGRAEMTASELEAALSWLERNRLADHLSLLDGDPRFNWGTRQRPPGVRQPRAARA